jgi:serine protease Do
MLSPDTKVDIVVLRDGKRETFTVKLGKRPPEGEIRGNLPADTIKELGFSVINMTEELATKLGYEGDNGVVVSAVEPGSQAEQAGIVPGVLIKEVNRQPVNNIKEFGEEIKKAQKKGTALLVIRQDSSEMFALIIFD